jgi:formate-dependent nitrite reductase membrane component NrfD
MVGCGLLIFELGSFHAGNWFRWMNLYTVLNLSPMSIGTWLLTLFIGVSLLYAYTFIPKAPGLGDAKLALRRRIAWVNVPLGIGVAVYTGVLLGVSTGIAVILLARALFQPKRPDPGEATFHESGYLLAASDVMLIGFELMVVFLFIMFAYLTVGDVRHAVSVILADGDLATLFWFGFVALGLVVPALIELFYVVPKLLYHRDYSASPWPC